MSERSFASGTGACRDPPAGRWNATKSASSGGKASAGPRLKKSANGRPHDRLHRRKRIKPTAASLPDLGTARADARAAIPLQLEDDLRSRRDDLVEIGRAHV